MFRQRYSTWHKNAVWALTDIQQINSDGVLKKIVVSGSHDGTVKTWDPDTLTLLNTFREQESEDSETDKIYSLSNLQNGRIALGAANCEIEIWDINKPRLVGRIPFADAKHKKLAGQHVYSITLIDAARIASQSADGNIRIIDADAREVLSVIPNISTYVSTVITTSHNSVVASEYFTSDEKHRIGLWDIETSQLLLKLLGHPGHYIRAFSPYGSMNILSGSNGYDVKLWDIRDRNFCAAFYGHENYVNTIAPISDYYFASASGDRTIRVWDNRKPSCSVETISGTHNSWIQPLIKLHDNVLVSGAGDGTIGVWDITQELAHQFYQKPPKHILTETGLSDSTPKINYNRLSATTTTTTTTTATTTTATTTTISTAAATDAHLARSLEVPAVQLGAPHEMLQIEDFNFNSDVNSESLEGEKQKKVTYRYLFEVVNNELRLTVKDISNAKFDMKFVNILVNTIEALSIKIGQPYTKVAMNMSEKLVEIYFPEPSKDEVLDVIIRYISYLRTSKLMEYFENSNSLWFYLNDGVEILNAANYPEGIQTYLSEERDTFKTTIDKSDVRYDTLVEVGCGSAENLKIARELGLKYLGLDFDTSKISKTHDEYSGDDDVDFECLNILNIDRSNALNEHEKNVFILPFNVFGNIAPISLLIAKFSYLGVDVLISIYKNDSATINVRHGYYSNCGYKNIQIKQSEFGVSFTSEDGLYSMSYHQAYLSKLLEIFGFIVDILDEPTYGIVLYAKKVPTEKAVQTPKMHSPTTKTVSGISSTFFQPSPRQASAAPIGSFNQAMAGGKECVNDPHCETGQNLLGLSSMNNTG